MQAKTQGTFMTLNWWPIVLPAVNMASASRSLLMICSGLCRFFGIKNLLALPGL
jgi:hypothetical protein